MNAPMTGTLIDNSIRLDQPVDLPNHSRVTVSIASLEGGHAHRLAAWVRLKELLHSRPLNSGGEHFSREELHIRD